LESIALVTIGIQDLADGPLFTNENPDHLCVETPSQDQVLDEQAAPLANAVASILRL